METLKKPSEMLNTILTLALRLVTLDIRTLEGEKGESVVQLWIQGTRVGWNEGSDCRLDPSYNLGPLFVFLKQ